MNSKFKVKNSRPGTAARPVAAALMRKIRARTQAPDFTTYLEKLLVELCRVNTTPSPQMAKMREAENRCFQILERELSALNFAGARLERRAINPAIRHHPFYSLPHFTKTAEQPRGLSPEKTYAKRSNLVYVAPGKGKNDGLSVALNAHIDVVAPYFPPQVKKEIVFGRGACDDKGPLVAMIAALKVLSEVLGETGLALNRNIVGMFVVEEETGGNGSLSLAMDRRLKSLYESVLVGEPTSLKIHPANRGAVWYRAELKPPAAISTLELAAFIIEAMEDEGAALRAESRHELFPQRPVQTCHGIMGAFGEHPSRICGEVRFKIVFSHPPGRAAQKQIETVVRDCLESGLAIYIGRYGDKTKVTDPATGQPMVVRHYDLQRKAWGFAVTVQGATGHMGAIRERDGAITKAAQLVRSLVFSKAKLAALGGSLRLELEGASPGERLILEGGQGFVPTHGIDEVMSRLRRAIEHGAENHLRRCGRLESGAEAVTVSYEKLHNAAFDGDPDSTTMRQALAAARLCGLETSEPVTGWTVSCDARLFATEYPGLPVLTFGPGVLAFAHSDREQIALPDLAKAVEFLTLFLLRQTGTLT